MKQCMEVPGAGKTLTQLKAGDEWGVALATGAWQRSAEFKIERARLPLDDVPKAYSEDGPSRESIVMTAITRAAAHYGQSSFDRIVSVGDAPWDVRTAARLKLPFLGVARGERAHRLRSFCACEVIEDYKDTSAFLSCLESAVVPENA